MQSAFSAEKNYGCRGIWRHSWGVVPPSRAGARKTRNWDRLMTLNETIFNANFGVSQRVTTGAFSEIYIYGICCRRVQISLSTCRVIFYPDVDRKMAVKFGSF